MSIEGRDLDVCDDLAEFADKWSHALKPGDVWIVDPRELLRDALAAVFDWLGFGNAELVWVCTRGYKLYWADSPVGPTRGFDGKRCVVCSRITSREGVDCGWRLLLPPTKETT